VIFLLGWLIQGNKKPIKPSAGGTLLSDRPVPGRLDHQENGACFMGFIPGNWSVFASAFHGFSGSDNATARPHLQ
jgi:hypothetical protein